MKSASGNSEPVPSLDEGGGLGGGVQIPPSGKTKDERNQPQMTDNLRKTCRPGRRPVTQGPRPKLGNRGCVKNSTTGTEEKIKVATEQMTIGTWNVQTLWSTGKLELLCKEMEIYNCDILGL